MKKIKKEFKEVKSSGLCYTDVTEFNKDGKVISISRLDEDDPKNSYIDRHKFTYDDDGRVSSELSYSSGMEMIEYVYTEDKDVYTKRIHRIFDPHVFNDIIISHDKLEDAYIELDIDQLSTLSIDEIINSATPSKNHKCLYMKANANMSIALYDTVENIIIAEYTVGNIGGDMRYITKVIYYYNEENKLLKSETLNIADDNAYNITKVYNENGTINYMIANSNDELQKKFFSTNSKFKELYFYIYDDDAKLIRASTTSIVHNPDYDFVNEIFSLYITYKYNEYGLLKSSKERFIEYNKPSTQTTKYSYEYFDDETETEEE